MAILHFAYLDHSGNLLEVSPQDSRALVASEPAAKLLEVFSAKLAKPVWMHAVGFEGQASTIATVQFSSTVQTSATVQISFGQRLMTTSILLPGVEPAVDRAALAAAHESLAQSHGASVTGAAGGVASDITRIIERPLVASFVWEQCRNPDERTALWLAQSTLAVAFFRQEGVVL